MPVATPEVGVHAKVTFLSDVVSSTLVTLKNSDWSIMRKSNNKDAHNTTDGILRAPGLADASGTVKGSVDTSERIEGDISVGTIGTMKFYTDGTKYFSMKVIIDSLSITTGLDQIENWDMAWSLQSGTITNPA